jgi:hypothetical protein
MREEGLRYGGGLEMREEGLRFYFLLTFLQRSRTFL